MNGSTKTVRATSKEQLRSIISDELERQKYVVHLL